mmetsp:Transcript_33783/g.61261  ORF Transcript_33783/g.61261 Transcript_33783/m.61261 type:complete len:435 (+) Transcript_33783:90-1394(+)
MGAVACCRRNPNLGESMPEPYSGDSKNSSHSTHGVVTTNPHGMSTNAGNTRQGGASDYDFMPPPAGNKVSVFSMPSTPSPAWPAGNGSDVAVSPNLRMSVDSLQMPVRSNGGNSARASLESLAEGEEYAAVPQKSDVGKVRSRTGSGKPSKALSLGESLTQMLDRGDRHAKYDSSLRNRPKRVILLRHGESMANVDRSITQRIPDHAVPLTEAGRIQALHAGLMLKDIVGDESVRFIVSPYVRARETYNGVMWFFRAHDEDVYFEDPRIRELAFGNFDPANMKQLHQEKTKFGAFWYRFPEGESPSDVYDRVSSFLESLYRLWQHPTEENYVIVGHGQYFLVFLMRFYGLSISEYYQLQAIQNAELYVLEKNEEHWYGKVTSHRYGEPPHDGLRMKVMDEEEYEKNKEEATHWDGKPPTSFYKQEAGAVESIVE